jgi:hypothetical protein
LPLALARILILIDKKRKATQLRIAHTFQLPLIPLKGKKLFTIIFYLLPKFTPKSPEGDLADASSVPL